MNIYAWFVVILVTSLVAFTLGCYVNRPGQDPAPPGSPPAPPPLPRAGRLELDRPFAGASQTGQPVPWDLAGAAYALGQQRESQDEISRQVDAIMLEVELDPRWKYR